MFILLLTLLKICLKRPHLKKGAVPMLMLNLIKSREDNNDQICNTMPSVEQKSCSDVINSHVNI
jgi:hypothetical protein